MANLFVRKPLKALLDEVHGEQRLRLVLGPVQLSSLGIGAIIGTGIFVLVGVAAHDRTGPALMLSFVAAGLTCVFAALCYAEFASMVPISGSAYTYSYATLGEVIAWIIGWDLIIEYAVGNIAVAISWANYFKTALSLYSSLNMHLIDPKQLGVDLEAPARFSEVQGALRHHLALPSALKSIGYDYVHLGGWWVREVQREYQFILTRRGELLWVYNDKRRRRWFLQGELQ